MSAQKRHLGVMLDLCTSGEYASMINSIQQDVVGGGFLRNLDSIVALFVDQKWMECAKYCEVYLDVTWEKLNTGYWKDVHISWRYAYTFLSVTKAFSEYYLLEKHEADLTAKDLMKTCDMGLLMGAPLLNNLLSRMAEHFRQCLVTSENLKSLDTATDKAAVEGPEAKRSRIGTLAAPLPNVNLQHEVNREALPSIETFKTRYMDKREPCVIEKSMDHWPALGQRKWTLDYIKTIAGCRTVPIEIGSKYTDEDWSQKLMLVSDFIDKFFTGDSSCSTQGYLAQHQLFDQIPELQRDISVPTYCSLSELDDDVDINAWFGPQGTISPLHYDPKHNFLCQVVGYKYIKLYSYEYTDCLYPHDTTLLCNTSQVDAEQPDLTKFPDFVKARCQECMLGPGEMLYIPPKHWHYVRSLSVSFSVSFWW